MIKQLERFSTLQEVMDYFSDAERGLAFMVSMRWPDGKPTCPECGSTHSSFISTRSKWKCMAKDCHRQYSAKAGTIFQDSPMGFDKWFPALWLIANDKPRTTSYSIHRLLGISQKSAWFMIHRIQLAMFDERDWSTEDESNNSEDKTEVREAIAKLLKP